MEAENEMCNKNLIWFVLILISTPINRRGRDQIPERRRRRQVDYMGTPTHSLSLSLFLSIYLSRCLCLSICLSLVWGSVFFIIVSSVYVLLLRSPTWGAPARNQIRRCAAHFVHYCHHQIADSLYCCHQPSKPAS